jgi:hypothetical protein
LLHIYRLLLLDLSVIEGFMFAQVPTEIVVLESSMEIVQGTFEILCLLLFKYILMSILSFFLLKLFIKTILILFIIVHIWEVACLITDWSFGWLMLLPKFLIYHGIVFRLVDVTALNPAWWFLNWLFVIESLPKNNIALVTTAVLWSTYLMKNIFTAPIVRAVYDCAYARHSSLRLHRLISVFLMYLLYLPLLMVDCIDPLNSIFKFLCPLMCKYRTVAGSDKIHIATLWVTAASPRSLIRRWMIVLLYSDLIVDPV